MNREVSVTKRIRTQNGLRYCPVVLAGNGRIRPDYVYVNGQQERHPEGSYYLSWYAGKKLIRLSVGSDAATASARRDQKIAEFNATNNGLTVLTETSAARTSVSKAVADYLDEVKMSKKPKTHSAYLLALKYFTESCPKTNLEEIDRSDLMRFSAFLRDTKELAPRTVRNYFEHVVCFLKAQGIQGLVKKKDRPQYVQQEPEIYEETELKALFDACDSEERVLFETFLMTGLREQEMMYLYWRDVNLKAGTVRVTYKRDRNWLPKAYKEREIPIPDKLVETLKAWQKKRNKACELGFPTGGCNPNFHFLECLKAVAKRAKLKEENFWLHKFRATFATRALWKGVDLRTVQAWLGHKDMESTLRYLKPSRSHEVRHKVNEIFREVTL